MDEENSKGVGFAHDHFEVDPKGHFDFRRGVSAVFTAI